MGLVVFFLFSAVEWRGMPGAPNQLKPLWVAFNIGYLLVHTVVSPGNVGWDFL